MRPLTLRTTRPTVQHGAASTMLWDQFAASGSAALKKVNEIMKREYYLQQANARQPTNLVEMHQLYQREWLNIQSEDYQKLVNGYQKQLIVVKLAKRHLTKY